MFDKIKRFFSEEEKQITQEDLIKEQYRLYKGINEFLSGLAIGCLIVFSVFLFLLAWYPCTHWIHCQVEPTDPFCQPMQIYAAKPSIIQQISYPPIILANNTLCPDLDNSTFGYSSLEYIYDGNGFCVLKEKW